MSPEPASRTPGSASQPDHRAARRISRRLLLKTTAAASLAAPVPGLLTWPAGMAAAATAASAAAPPVIPPLPSAVRGVRHPVIDLGGRWHFTTTPPQDFWTDSTDPSAWPLVTVPGEPAMQGIPVPSDTECACKTQITPPADFAGQRVFLRCDGVYSYARLWVGGTYITDHTGGFTTWYADITDYVTPGQPSWITIGVTDQSDSIADASGYAFHNIGGILRDLSLVALPPAYLTALHTATVFDASYRNATLQLTAAAQLPAGATARLHLRLTGPDGAAVPLRPPTLALSAAAPQASAEFAVLAPRKWDAEHPNLYTLTATLTSGQSAQTVQLRTGFRQVEMAGNRLLLNGQPLHLRGSCHHHISPDLGRSTTVALDEQDIVLLKQANVNFIRTSHYPPTPALLAAADRHGMYIEEESAVCFQGTTDDPTYLPLYLSQFAEMIERDRDHACVIEWSLGNESGYGSNFAAENAYEHQADTTRPTVFEDAAVANGGSEADIYSGHYPAWNGALGNPAQPIQYDEFAHCPNYDISTLQNDPGVHNFWGQSIARFAQAFRDAGSGGVVGGAIWAGIDDIFELPGGLAGYGEWGLLDIWRRQKPEYWLARQAYCPVRIANEPLPVTAGEPITVPVSNWHDFTSLSELTVSWQLGSRHGTAAGPDIGPGASGTLTIPAQRWQAGDILHLQFRASSGEHAGEFSLPLGAARKPQFPAAGGATPLITEDSSTFQITGTDVPFTVTVSKASGQITDASIGGRTVITGGPALDLPGGGLGAWALTSLTAAARPPQAVVTIAGTCGSVSAQFEVAIDGRGLITTTCTVASPPAAPAGGYTEAGIRYTLTADVDTVSWERDAQWSVYPADHIGRGSGRAAKTRPGPTDTYRVRPAWPWSADQRDYYLFGAGSGLHPTSDFRSTKENIYFSAATIGASGPGLRAESDGSAAAQLTPHPPLTIDDTDPSIVYTGNWTHAGPSAGYTSGDYDSTESFSDTAGDSAELTFTGTGVVFLSATDSNLGLVAVYLDGSLDATLDLYGNGKVPDQAVYTKTGLAAGEHTITVAVTGQRNPSATDSFVLVDGFQVLTSGQPDSDLDFTVKSQWNYPDIDWGNYIKPAITLPANYTATAATRLIAGS